MLSVEWAKCICRPFSIYKYEMLCTCETFLDSNQYVIILLYPIVKMRLWTDVKQTEHWFG